MNQEIRIIGGKLRGKKISFPVSEGLRPTPARIRETLFNWLMQPIMGARCLDAFAGSGALGIEAFSRGAQQVIFVEQSKTVYKHLSQVLQKISTLQLEVIHQDSMAYLQQARLPFDIVFLDPPFDKNLHHQLLDLLIEKQLLHQQSLVYIESPALLALKPEQWEVQRSKKAGNVYYSLLRPLIK